MAFDAGPRSLPVRVRALLLSSTDASLVTRGALATLGVRGLGAALALGVAVLLARVAGPAAYGTYVYAATWASFLLVPTLLGLDYVIVRFVPTYRADNDLSRLRGLLRFATLAALGTGLLAALAAAGLVLALPILDRSLMITFVIAFAGLPLATLVQVRQAALRGLDRTGRAQLPEAIVQPLAIYALVGLVVGLGGRGLSGPLIALIALTAALPAFAVGTLLLVRALPRELRAATPIVERRIWLGMVPALVAVGLIQFAQNRADLVIVGALAGVRDAGVYAVALRAAELLLFLLDATMLAAAPVIARLHAAGRRDELQHVLRVVAWIVLGGTLPVALGLAVAAPWVLQLFGPEFVAGATALRVLVAAHFLGAVAGFVGVILYMTGHQRDVAVVMACSATLNVLLNLALVPRFGITGAAVAAAVSLVAFKAVLVVVVQRRVGVSTLPFPLRSVRPGGSP